MTRVREGSLVATAAFVAVGLTFVASAALAADPSAEDALYVSQVSVATEGDLAPDAEIVRDGQPISIAEAIAAIAARNDVAVVFPVHPNPHVRSAMEPILGDLTNVALIDPLDIVFNGSKTTARLLDGDRPPFPLCS